MATKKTKGQAKHVGTVPDQSQDEADRQQEDNRVEGASVKTPFRQGFRDYIDYSIGQDHFNPWTERSPKFTGEGKAVEHHTLEDERNNRKKGNKFFAFLMDIRDIGVLSRMDSGEVYARDQKGNLKHSNYMVRAWNKVQAYQIGAKALGEAAKDIAGAVGQYEHWRGMR